VLKYYDATLASRPYLTGDDFTAADIQNHFIIRLGLSAAATAAASPPSCSSPTPKPSPPTRRWRTT